MWVSSITGKGLELMQRFIVGDGALIITGAKGGTETVDAAQMYAQEDVSGEAHTLELSGCQQVSASSGTVLRANAKVYKEKSSTGGKAYTLKQIGLYAKLMDGETEVVGETLIALYQIASGSGINVPLSSSILAELVHELSMALSVSNTGDAVALECAPEVFVSEDQMDDVLGAQRAKKLQATKTVYITNQDGNRLYGMNYWKEPGTTWRAGRWYHTVTYYAHTFTAPDDMYACALRVEGVRSDSIIMEAWIDANGEYPACPIEYETIDDGWIMLTCAQKPESVLSIGMVILI
jgi:hypothetical protein